MLRKILILFLIISVAPVFGQEEMMRIELKKADKLVAEGNYEKAMEHIQKVLDIDGLHLDALEKKVNVMIRQENTKDLLKEINEYIDEHLQQPEYYYLRALVYIYRGKQGKAIEDLDNAEYYQMPAKYHDKLFLTRGVAYYNLGDFFAAETDYRAALEVNERNATVYHSWGMLDYEKGLFDEAIKKFNKAIQYGDESLVLYFNLAMAYLKNEDKYNACFYYNKACSQGFKNACKSYLMECAE